MYALGSDPAELASFVDLAKSDHAAAIRKFVLLEHLTGERARQGFEGRRESRPIKARAKAPGATDRDESGKIRFAKNHSC